MKNNIYHLIFLLVLSTTFTLLAKNYRLERIDIQGRILPEGNLQITEARTYHFQGSFSWADYRLPLQGVGEVQSFTLRDEYQDYVEKEGEEAGTYYREAGSDQFYVKWFYRAKDETRTFILQYLVTDAVTRYEDIAEFYYQFVGPANQSAIREVQISIELPQPASYPEVRAWAHGPLWGEVNFRDGRVLLHVTSLPRGQFWEARVLFPGEWVTETARRVPGPALGAILAEEDAWAQQANRERERAREKMLRRKENESRAWNYALLATVIGLAGFLFLYIKYGKGHPETYQQTISSELPLDEPPAITSTLFFNKQVLGYAMTSTLFDLARRGYLSIEQTRLPEKKWWGTKPPEFAIKQGSPQTTEKPLLDFEDDLLDFIFRELGEGRAMVEFSSFTRNRSKVRRWFMEWKKRVRGHVKDIRYYEKDSTRATLYSTILSLMVIAAGVLIIVSLGIPGILALLAGTVLFGLSFVILCHTPEIKLRLKKMKALKAYIGQYHFLTGREGETPFANFESYLIYGMALGLGKKEIEKLILGIPADYSPTYIPWYHYAAGAGESPADLASSVSTMISIASSTVSSSTGSGGGASGGGGGGGGGASGGAG